MPTQGGKVQRKIHRKAKFTERGEGTAQNATGTTRKKSEELAGEPERITDDTRNQNSEELAGERGKTTNTRSQDQRAKANSPPPGENGRPFKDDTRRPPAACERIDSPRRIGNKLAKNFAR